MKKDSAIIIRPRLTDYHGVGVTQEEVDFAIPYVNEDIPLYVDPFLLWMSPSMQDNALHTSLLNSFNNLIKLANSGKEDEAVQQIVIASECEEAGLGTSAKRKGHRISEKSARLLVEMFKSFDHLRENGFIHFEEIQLYVENISKDRISDFTCSFLKSFLIDYTIEQCQKYGIPVQKVEVSSVYDQKKFIFKDKEQVELPVNPENGAPILLVPKRWLRSIPWINYDDYYEKFFVKEAKQYLEGEKRVSVLQYNRENYGYISAYLERKEKECKNCKIALLFEPISIHSAKGKLRTIKALPTGKGNNADKKFENAVSPLLASMLYPDIDFAQEQVRADSGVTIKDLIFYNNKTHSFLEEIWNDFDSRQLVFELKNVKEVERDHINQVSRYLSDSFGKFGVIVTRNRVPRKIFQNTIDLWSGQRKCIIILDDADIDLMVNIYESKQRDPIEIIKKKFVEFKRACPS